VRLALTALPKDVPDPIPGLRRGRLTTEMYVSPVWASECAMLLRMSVLQVVWM
jgi:hypothetical protein